MCLGNIREGEELFQLKICGGAAALAIGKCWLGPRRIQTPRELEGQARRQTVFQMEMKIFLSKTAINMAQLLHSEIGVKGPSLLCSPFLDFPVPINKEKSSIKQRISYFNTEQQQNSQ